MMIVSCRCESERVGFLLFSVVVLFFFFFVHENDRFHCDRLYKNL